MDQSMVLLTPATKDYLWGGNKLRYEFGKESDLDKIAETWELSVHKDGQSVVSSGKFRGKTLEEYIEANGKACLGKNALAFDKFPILIKLIDAADSLSIQVHPSDEYALKVEGEYGKTEMWYILSCDEDAFLYYGLNQEVTKEEFKERIENNTVLEVLQKVPVHPGDVFFISPGTIHAIGKGIVLCEIQQNSNTTYRVYDFDRRDKDGNPRELHVEKALAVAELKPAKPTAPAENGLLASCKYFTVKAQACHGEAEVEVAEDCFRAIMVVDGKGTLSHGGESLSVKKGDCIFVPAQNGKIKAEGNMELVISYV